MKSRFRSATRFSRWGVLALFLLFVVCPPGRAQDVAALLDRAPAVSLILTRACEKLAPFTATAEVVVSMKGEPSPTSASARLQYDSGKLRWDLRLGDVRSPMLTSNARTAVRRVNGDRFFVLVRSAERFVDVVLPGADACLEQPLPTLKLSRSRASTKKETLDQVSCVREPMNAVVDGQPAIPVVIWRSKSPPGSIVQLQIQDGDTFIRVKLKDVRPGTPGGGPFRVPERAVKYATLEDLMQSVVVDEVKKRLGL